MPLFNKAQRVTEEEIETMTFTECYELLLIFRYLQFRQDATLPEETILERMDQLRKRMYALNSDAAVDI
jgi:hypothetical protein